MGSGLDAWRALGTSSCVTLGGDAGYHRREVGPTGISRSRHRWRRHARGGTTPRALPASDAWPPCRRRRDAVWGPRSRGRRRGAVVRPRPSGLQMYTRPWLGTYGGRGHAHDRAALGVALRATTATLPAVAWPPTAGMVRVDGQSGDAPVRAQILETGRHVVARGRGYALLDDPRGQPVLAGPPLTSVTAPHAGRDARAVRAARRSRVSIPARSGRAAVRGAPDAPPRGCRRGDGEVVSVGQRVCAGGEDRCVTTRPAEGFLATDRLDLAHGRGAFEGTVADEDPAVRSGPLVVACDRWPSVLAGHLAGSGSGLCACCWDGRCPMPRRRARPRGPAPRPVLPAARPVPRPLPGQRSMAREQAPVTRRRRPPPPPPRARDLCSGQASELGLRPFEWGGVSAARRWPARVPHRRAPVARRDPSGNRGYATADLSGESAGWCWLQVCRRRTDCGGRSARRTPARRVSAHRRRRVPTAPPTRLTPSALPASLPVAG
jgi:hypothetical protein